jgi:hypothetical protein
MPLVTQSIPDLYSGVSQLPAIVRPDGAAQDALNTIFTVARGARKRPPTEHRARLQATPDNAFIHHINRDVSERYVVVLTDGDLKVYDVTSGAEVPVTFPDGKAYLDVLDPREDYAAVTVADYTFIVNKTRATAMRDVIGEYTPPNYYASLNVRTFGGFLAAIGLAALYQRIGTVPSSPMQTVASVTDLPKNAPQGALYRVSGSTETAFTSYYLIRNGGVWDETTAPNLKNEINASTMPHALIRQADGTFVLTPFDWAPRRVGDEDTNPVPTFIGRAIKDVFYSQNRLAFLVDENVVGSVIGDFGNFWRRTILDALDSDPLDIAADDARVNILLYAVPFRDDIMLFSDQGQFNLRIERGGLTGSNVSLTKTTAYELASAARPVNLGPDVYFGSENGGYVTIREYQFDRERQSNVANDLTAQVSRLIPAGLRFMVASVDNDMLFVNTEGARKRLYVYRQFWANGRKLQSAWVPWEFDGEVVSATAIDQYLFVVLARPDGLFLERIDLYEDAEPDGYMGQVFLDRRAVPVLRTYDAGNVRTTLTLAYPVTAPFRSSFRLVAGGGAPHPGALLDPAGYVWISDTQVSVPGDWRIANLLGGIKYTMRFTFSPFFVKRQDGTAVQGGRLQLRTMALYYERTGYFKVEIVPKAGPARTETILPGFFSTFAGKTIGDAGLMLGTPVYGSGNFRFPVQQQNSTVTVSITNDSHVNSEFYAAEWEAEYNNRARF